MVWRGLLLLLLVGHVWSEICPGGKVKCLDRMTCCPLANHEYGCCTYPDAQCCNDHVHCCPSGMKCDTRHQACLKDGFPAAFFSQTSIEAEPVEEVEGNDRELMTVNVIEDTLDDSRTCPDGHKCPSSFTCCKMYRGSYGCCPYSDAKCCKDGFHCCPHGSQCDPVSGGCQYDGNWLGKAASMIRGKKPKPTTPPKTIEHKDPGGKCPDGHPCPEKYTCCNVEDGRYGCCPYTDAVCCTDRIHCCPKNTTCNNSMGTCDVEKDYSIPLYSTNTLRLSQGPVTLRPAIRVASEVMCPDQRSKCASGNTCCPSRDGTFACCPMSEATCCSENDSCCPGGYQCAEGGKCERVTSIPSHPFLPSITHKQRPTTTTTTTTTAAPPPPPSVEVDSVKAEYVHCPDGTLCPDQNTCCQVSYNRFGCCPMPQATCCGDMIHCCPHGTWCADGGCERLPQGTFTNTSIMIAFTSIVTPHPNHILTP